MEGQGVLLTLDALRLMMPVKPDWVVRQLANAIEAATTKASVQAAVRRVKNFGIEPMIVAAVGSPRVARALAVDLYLATSLQDGEPTVTQQGLLCLGGSLRLGDIKAMVIPWVQEVGGDLYLENAENVFMDELRVVRGDIHLANTENVYLRALQTAGGSIDLRGAENVLLPQLWDISEKLYLANAVNVPLPALQTVNGNPWLSGRGPGL